MKKNKLVKLLFALTAPLFILACDEDEGAPATAPIDFLSIASSYNEENGTGTLTLPLRGSANANDYSFEFGGSATEGEDYEVIGVSGEGFQINIIDDNIAEPTETVRVHMVSTKLNLSGNAVHTVTIVSECEDTSPDIDYFVGDWNATEMYGPTPDSWYGPYEITLIQDKTDPNTYHFDNLYDNHCNASMIFNLQAGTVYFPDQKPCGKPLTESSGTFTMDPCNTTLTINLNYDGGDWVYSFNKL